MPNRLARERSPYLLQHADNPVDWWPWGEDAFEKARREDKPIFLSIGYSTCHWCHVMAHESFEDDAIASALNRDFVSIKLDREERPDVDRVYMSFVQATTGAGGWPMSVWLTPELKPFFGGTYFPPSTRWGRPGFIDVLTQLAGAWKGDRATLVQASNEVIERLREFTSAGQAADHRSPVAGRDALDFGVQLFAKSFDPRHGGFGGSPKFPRPSELLFLLQTHALTGDEIAKRMATETLHAMALGGMRDQIGGGFHRYSVDAEWRVPHFEKMLYDQAQLVLAYLDAAQATGDAFYAAVAEDTLGYVRREMTAPDGAFYSAEDADSTVPAAADGTGDVPAATDEHAHGKKEGAFYVWSVAEIDRLLGDDADVVRRRYGIEPPGNALSDPQGEFRGQNILYVAQSIEDVATRSGRDADAVMAALARARVTLFEARAARPRPHLDDKIITAWNGMMIAAFAHAARVLVDSPRREAWRESAIRAATAVRALLWDDGRRRLLRRYRDGEAAIDGFCEDYACLVWGLTELFQTTGDAAWLEWSEAIVAAQVEQFWDEQDAGWFSTSGADPSVLLRLKEDYDGAEPSAASVSVRNLILLGQITGDASYTTRAARSLERYGAQIGQSTRVMPLMVSNVAFWNATKAQVVVTGPHASAARQALEGAVGLRYLPFAAVVLTDAATQPALASRLPWLAAMGAGDPAPAVYVCRDFVCQAPERDPARLSALLIDLAAPRRIITS